MNSCRHERLKHHAAVERNGCQLLLTFFCADCHAMLEGDTPLKGEWEWLERTPLKSCECGRLYSYPQWIELPLLRGAEPGDSEYRGCPCGREISLLVAGTRRVEAVYHRERP